MHKASMKLTLNEEKKETRCCNVIRHIKAIFIEWFSIIKATFVLTVPRPPLVFVTTIHHHHHNYYYCYYYDMFVVICIFTSIIYIRQLRFKMFPGVIRVIHS